MILTNPIVLSVIIMTVLCLLKLNVILALIVSSIICGLLGGTSIAETMGIFVNGMGGNSETALSIILLGILAVAMQKTGVADVLTLKISKIIKGKGIVLLVLLAFMGMVSETIILVYIAFIPILIPPLLPLMNKLKMDRRAVASALVFGLKSAYITLPIGYGLIYHNIIRDQMGLNGMEITTGMVWKSVWVAGLAMLTGFIISLYIFRKPREYKTVEITESKNEEVASEYSAVATETQAAVTKKHYFTLVAAISALVVQLAVGSMPLGALTGLIIMVATRAIKWSEMDEITSEGIKMMGLIAFVMLAASGYSAVVRETGNVGALIEMSAGMMAGSKFIAATIMLLLGLVVTMGIGTSFGTIPIIAVIYVPLCLQVGFSPKATILLIAIAAALGDAGSPASDTTLGPTAGLNVDGQHDHIWDTCVPTFLCYNIPLIVFGIIGALIFS